MDIVVPAHPKDFEVLRHAVRGAVRHVRDRGRVFVVSPEDPGIGHATWIDEASLPDALPSLDEVRSAWSERGGDPSRAGWLYQQLLKLAAGSAIPGVSDRYMVMDADVIFLRTIEFSQGLGEVRFPYSIATEHQQQYLDVCEALLGELVGTQSFTSHFMVFDREFVEEMRAELQQRHGQPWWRAILAASDPALPSAFSEWNLYGHWVLARHPDDAGHRQLRWLDVRTVPSFAARASLGVHCDFVAAHAYSRERRADHLRVLLARLVREIQHLVQTR